jgi:large subunit ribosomal protein L13
MKTYLAKDSEVVKKWVVIDAADKPLGRVASKAASIVRGKTKPTFTPHVDTGDNVIIINANKVKLTGDKMQQKTYYRHTGFFGGIKALSAKQWMEKNASEMIRIAIKGMLPKNRLGRTLHNNFRIYNGSEHPHTSQNPQVVAV